MISTAVELLNGKAVVLKQGIEKIFEEENVLNLVKKYGKISDITIIDIDAAVGNGSNEDLIKKCCEIAPCKVAGGIKNTEKAKQLLEYGATKIIISPTRESVIQEMPSEKVLVAIDTQKGQVVTHGTTRTTPDTPEEVIRRFNNKCSGFVYTNIDKKGTLSSIDLEKARQLRGLTNKNIIFAGGISSVQEIIQLQEAGITAQIATAFFTGKVKIAEAFAQSVNFEKHFGSIPTIVQDIDSKQVLLLEYSTMESLMHTLKTGNCTYFDKAQNRLRTKGEESGNTQELVFARYNDKRDSLLFQVSQKGNAGAFCQYSSFGEKENSINELYKILLDKKRMLPDNFELTALFKDEYQLKKKIMSSAFDVINYEKANGLADSSAELTKYLLALLVQKETTPQEILDILSSRIKP